MNSKKVNWLFIAIFVTNLAVNYGLVYYLTHGGTIGIVPLMMVSEIVFLIPCGLFLVGTRTNFGEMLAQRGMKISTAFMIILFTFLCMPLVTVVNLFSQYFVSNAVESSSDVFMSMPFTTTFFIIAVYAPACEEIVFRAITYESLKKDLNVFQAMCLSALFFGLAHMNFNQASYAVLLGIILVLVREATGSIWATILMHGLFNAWNVVLMYGASWLMQQFPEQFSSGEQVVETASQRMDSLSAALCVYIVIAAVASALAACVLVWIAGNEGRKENLANIWRKRKEGRGKVMRIPFLAVLILYIGKMIFDAVA